MYEIWYPLRELRTRGSEEGGTHGEVAQVDDCPRKILRHARDDIEEHDPHEDEHDVDEPGACKGWLRVSELYGSRYTSCDAPVPSPRGSSSLIHDSSYTESIALPTSLPRPIFRRAAGLKRL